MLHYVIFLRVLSSPPIAYHFQIVNHTTNASTIYPILTPICRSTSVHTATTATLEDTTIGDPPSLPYHTNQTHPLLPLCRSAPSPFLHHGSHALTSAPMTTSIHRHRSPPLPYTHCHSLPLGLPPPTIYRRRSTIADITIAISTHAGTPLSLSKHGRRSIIQETWPHG